jgi:hypothetical protein
VRGPLGGIGCVEELARSGESTASGGDDALWGHTMHVAGGRDAWCFHSSRLGPQ